MTLSIFSFFVIVIKYKKFLMFTSVVNLTNCKKCIEVVDKIIVAKTIIVKIVSRKNLSTIRFEQVRDVVSSNVFHDDDVDFSHLNR